MTTTEQATEAVRGLSHDLMLAALLRGANREDALLCADVILDAVSQSRSLCTGGPLARLTGARLVARAFEAALYAEADALGIMHGDIALLLERVDGLVRELAAEMTEQIDVPSGEPVR